MALIPQDGQEGRRSETGRAGGRLTRRVSTGILSASRECDEIGRCAHEASLCWLMPPLPSSFEPRIRILQAQLTGSVGERDLPTAASVKILLVLLGVAPSSSASFKASSALARVARYLYVASDTVKIHSPHLLCPPPIVHDYQHPGEPLHLRQGLSVLGKLIRVLLALTAIAPLSISLAYIFAAKENNFRLAAIAALSCVLLGAASMWIVEKAGEKLERLPVVIKKAKSADKEVIGFFIAYALPLLFRGEFSPDLGAWILAGALLLFVLWSTHAIQVNPVLGMLGFHFYEVETSDSITYLLITRRTISNALSIDHIVQLSEYGILEAKRPHERKRI
jgi:membrane protein YqaA with SNARE-associated domain